MPRPLSLAIFFFFFASVLKKKCPHGSLSWFGSAGLAPIQKLFRPKHNKDGGRLFPAEARPSGLASSSGLHGRAGRLQPDKIIDYSKTKRRKTRLNGSKIIHLTI